ncbi:MULTISPECIES: hypothetical protein [unclassified Pseudomonas]|uniref:hypothetical protein n=1 Tax=unclassified Pseudomonas TaxID=196821 RepID=UPI0025E7294F|nr:MULTISPECIES: hypothetical protein [unclassified Pseudomonas]
MIPVCAGKLNGARVHTGYRYNRWVKTPIIAGSTAMKIAVQAVSVRSEQLSLVVLEGSACVPERAAQRAMCSCRSLALRRSRSSATLDLSAGRYIFLIGRVVIKPDACSFHQRVITAVALK